MLCQRCEAQTKKRGSLRRPARPSGILACERCGAAVLSLDGFALGAGDDTLAQLARFGLAETGKPLLEPRREGT